MTPHKVCVIGAGVSGLTAIKALKDQQIPCDCFEMGSQIGGLWRYKNDNGRAAAYESLVINTSKKSTEFADFPMDKSYPTFAHNTEIVAYLEAYAERFNLLPLIQFRTQVVHVTPHDGGYAVTTRQLDSDETQTGHYGAVMVCNGHHWQPNVAHFNGHFDGEMLHSSQYKSDVQLQGKRVLVVGIGNSGVDIACVSAETATATYLSTRRSAHILPRQVGPIPADRFVTPFSAKLPLPIVRASFATVKRLAVGNQAKAGVRQPDHQLLSEHPTVSQFLLGKVKAGDIDMKPNITRLDGQMVHFEDGSSAEIDLIILATGYKISFPFFEPNFLDVQDNDLRLYLHVVDPDHANLFFIGFVQPLGSIMPLAEQQSKLVASLLSNRSHLPTKAEMYSAIAAQTEAIRKRYVASKRHTIQVDYFPYMAQLKQAMHA